MHDSGCVNADVEIAQLRCLPLEPIAQPNRGTAGTAGNDSGHQAAYARTPQVNPLKTDVDVTYRGPFRLSSRGLDAGPEATGPDAAPAHKRWRTTTRRQRSEPFLLRSRSFPWSRPSV